MNKPNTKFTNISRIDQKSRNTDGLGQHGWWVRISRNKVKYHNFFNDNRYNGDKDKRLEIAILYRDAIKTQFLDNPNSIAVTDKMSSKNSSGIVGVYREKERYSENGKILKHAQWRCFWPDGIGSGGSKSRSFSVSKCGEEKAFKLAFEARQKGLAGLKRECQPALIPPKDLNQKIWRYMDFTKFISMLEERSLYFSCISVLNDQFEGTMSEINKLLRPLIYKNMHIDKIPIQIKKLRDEVAVNCWHSGNYESAAMWELYSKSNESVCIQSTYKKLRSSLSRIIDIGVVQYIDYKKEYIPEHDPYLVFLYKRKSFEHEREIRGVIKKLDNVDKGKGKFVKVDLDMLIGKIYISPSSPIWFYELVNKTLKRYNLSIEIIHSSLADDPVY
jgi:hypothetical protein